MDDIIEAAAAAQEIRALAFDKLRSRYPFLNADALDDLVKDVESCTKGHLKKQQVAMTQSKARFSFFSIPPELRNRIYEDVLVGTAARSQDVIDIAQYSSGGHPGAPPLLHVNKQMRDETLPIYLGQNTFLAMIHLPKRPGLPLDVPLTRWLKVQGPKSAKLIKTLTLQFIKEDERHFRAVFEKWTGGPIDITRSGIFKLLGLGNLGVEDDAVKVLCWEASRTRTLGDNGEWAVVE